MSGIDRRSLMGVAGAGLVLASCRSKDQDMPVIMNTAGYDDPFGQHANDTAPSSGSAKFNPLHLCVVYIKHEKGVLSVRHAYLDLKGVTDDQAIFPKAKELILAISTGDYKHVEVERIEDNFNKFSFNSQQVVVFYVDSPDENLKFADLPLPYIIMFTKYSGKGTKNIKENHAFLNMRDVNFGDYGPGWTLKSNKGYALNFWNTNYDGDPISNVNECNPTTHHIYSMNIHLQMALAALPAPSTTPTLGQSPCPTVPPVGKIFIPIILDPDTGNMGGGP